MPALAAPAPALAPEGDLRALLADVARRLDGTRPGLMATLKFDFGPDGVYRFVIGDGRVALEEGEGEAVAWVKMKGATALKIFRRKLNPMAAVVTGRIRVGGDLKAFSVTGMWREGGPAGPSDGLGRRFCQAVRILAPIAAPGCYTPA